MDSRPGKWLFYELNPEKWSQKEISDYKVTDVEAASLANFPNFDFFCHEFELIERFDNGIQTLAK